MHSCAAIASGWLRCCLLLSVDDVILTAHGSLLTFYETGPTCRKLSLLLAMMMEVGKCKGLTTSTKKSYKCSGMHQLQAPLLPQSITFGTKILKPAVWGVLQWYGHYDGPEGLDRGVLQHSAPHALPTDRAAAAGRCTLKDFQVPLHVMTVPIRTWRHTCHKHELLPQRKQAGIQTIPCQGRM